MVDELVLLIKRSDNVDDLVTSLLEKKLMVEGQDINKLFYQLKEIYRFHNSLKDPSHDLKPLPGRAVSLNGRTYYIHGVIHPIVGNPASEGYKQALQKAAEGGALLCEDGFKEDFFPEADIFNEAHSLGLNTFRNYARNFPRILRLLGSLAVDNLLDRKPPIAVREIKTITDLREARAELFRGYLPEPLGMNFLLYLYPSSTRVKRYVFEAERAISYASEKNLNELHIMVGCAHELPLEYLLSNPNKIQEFRSRLKWKS